MINYFRKMKFAIWIVIILTVTNLATIGTIVYHTYKWKSNHLTGGKQTNHGRSGKFFLQKELNLNPQQEVKYKEYRVNFFSESKEIFGQLELKRTAMIAEMARVLPDTVKLYKYSDEIGALHASLKRLQIKHLLELKNICTPEQNVKLDSLYQRLIGPEGPMRHRDSKEGWNHDKPNLKAQ